MLTKSSVHAGALLALVVVLSLLGCGGGSGPVNLPTDPTPPVSHGWSTPVHHYTAEVFPYDYIVGKQYKFVLMQSVGDAVNAAENEFVVGLYDETGALYPWRPQLRMVSVGDLFVNEEGRFTALDPGQKVLKVEVRDAEEHLYATITFGPYFCTGLLWDSPIKRANIEAQPTQYIAGQFYDMELITNMGDLYNRQPDEVSIGLYRKDDEGAIFSDVLGLKFIPSGASLYINEFGRFSADSAGVKTVIAEVVDAQGHLYVTVVFHPVFVSQGTPPPPDCRDLHPTKEAINGFWWDCVNGNWQNTGVPVNPPPPDKDLFPMDANPSGYYSGSGQQSLTLELQPIPDGVGWINWEIPSGPSGAFTVPLGIPQVQCEFYYTVPGIYTVRATPYESESSFDTGGSSIGDYATFTVSIAAG
ncbi:hypothetical protein KJ836_00290 [Patescibacteria group bacterium]|nr:hypothetical protein [Patescibacteria group bacterium]